MSTGLNQHFVPQFFFRLFNGGERHICLLNLRDGRIITRASVRGQCARHKYYGSNQVERALAHLESRHAHAFRRILDVAWNPMAPALAAEESRWLLEGLMLQRDRVPRHNEIIDQCTEDMYAHLDREFVSASPGLGDSGEALRTMREQFGELGISTVHLSLSTSLKSVIAITDLRVALLRNHTDYPFIFSDSPVVLYNRYQWAVTDRGVLGWQSPGLLVFLPLNSRTQLMLYDAEVYSCRANGLFVDPIDRGDVSQLNALQLHTAQQNVYYADESSEDYINRFFYAHRSTLRPVRGAFRVHTPGAVLIRDQRSRGEVLHMFEPQLPYRIDTSFIEVTSHLLEGGRFRPRNT